MPESMGHGDDLREAEIGRILSDYADRRAAGQAESEAELLAAHPELADELRPHLEMLRGLGGGGARIEALIAQGVLQKEANPEYPARLGPYRISGFIGQGGMGIVLKAEEDRLQRSVALKILRPDLAGDQATLARFKREAQAAAALQHPNIVTVHAVGEESGVHYLALEHVDGPSLQALIHESGPLPEETVSRYFGQMLSALARAHEAGLIHRDIKSSNLLVDRANESVKIADFGLARMQNSVTRMTTTGSILGTPEYMSPEQARGSPEIDHRTDLYSAGVVLYEMLTGRTPFRADTTTGVIHQILHSDPPDPRQLTDGASPTLASLALRLMAKRPEDRFESAAEALATMGVDRPVHSPERRRRQYRHGLWGIAALVVLLVVWWTPWAGAPNRGPIMDVHLDPLNPHRILAQYRNDATPQPFHDFPEHSEINLREPVLLDADGRGNPVVVAASGFPLDRENNALVAFDGNGQELWRKRLDPDKPWPGYGTPRSWHVNLLEKYDFLPGRPGEEILAVAHHPEYAPARISLLSPIDGEVLSSFWHVGHMLGALVLPDFLENERPAVLLWGIGHGLCQVSEGVANPRKRLTPWSPVGAVMILDPQSMNGIGPFHNRPDQLPVTPGPDLPYAYAYLDRPAGGERLYLPPIGDRLAGTTDGPDGQIWRIDWIGFSVQEPDRSGSAWFRIALHGITKAGERIPAPSIDVDQDLNVVGVGPALSSHVEAGWDRAEYWQECWRPIVQRGRYVGP